MKKFIFVLLSFLQINLFGQNKSSTYQIFQHSKKTLVGNNWVYEIQNQDCNYSLVIDKWKISINGTNNYYWEVVDIKDEVVDGINHTVEYDCEDKSGKTCKMFLNWSDKESSIATLHFKYPTVITDWVFREK